MKSTLCFIVILECLMCANPIIGFPTTDSNEGLTKEMRDYFQSGIDEDIKQNRSTITPSNLSNRAEIACNSLVESEEAPAFDSSRKETLIANCITMYEYNYTLSQSQ